MTARGRIAIIGAGPGGMAAALAAHRQGFEVALFERQSEIRTAGNILNLWPPPQKILKLLSVDTIDLGAPCHIVVARRDGHVRADIRLPPEVVAECGVGCIGLLRQGLHDRMRAALPEGMLRLGHECTALRDRGEDVVLSFAEHPNHVADIVVGADGLRSFIRRALWGPEPIRNQGLHLVGGYLLMDTPVPAEGVIAHNRTTQVSYTPIRHEGRDGYQWWVLEACTPNEPPPADLHAFCAARARGFSPLVQDLIARTPTAHLQRWEIRDRRPRAQWSKGSTTLVGDAAHPISPYASHGAGLSIEDGHVLAQDLAACRITDTADVRRALQAYETRRKPITAKMSQQAYRAGKLFHHMPLALRPLRDLLLDHTPLLQKLIGDATPSKIVAQLAEIA